MPDFVVQQLELADADEAYAAGYVSQQGGPMPPHRESPEEERLRVQLEVGVVEALEALLNLGPLTSGGGEAAQIFALKFLQMMALRGPHLREPVEAALAALLRFNTNFIGHYFKMSIVDWCTRIPRPSRAPHRAVGPATSNAPRHALATRTRRSRADGAGILVAAACARLRFRESWPDDSGGRAVGVDAACCDDHVLV